MTLSADVSQKSPRPAAPAPAEVAPSLRIAFLSYRSDPKVGGQGIYLSQAAAALARRGHRVDILSGPPYPVVPAGVALVRIPSLDLYAQPHNGHRALRWRHLQSLTDLAEYFGHLSGKFMEPYTFGRRVAKHLRTQARRYDVVLDNQTLAYGLLDIQQRGTPVVGVIHHPIRKDLEFAVAVAKGSGMRWLARRWYGFLKMQEAVAPQLRSVIVVSESSGRDVAQMLGVSPAVCEVVPLGVDGSVFKPHPDLRRHPSRLVTTASSDTPLKGLPYLLEAYARLRQTRPDLVLTVVGRLREGPTAELLDRLGLRSQVEFVHDLSNAEMARLFATATVCVTPSLYEGFGLPAAEAMACGTPVVVTDGGALPEVVGDAGVVAPRADGEALAMAIGALLDDPVRRAELGAAGLDRARSRFSWDRVAERYEQILLAAVARC